VQTAVNELEYFTELPAPNQGDSRPLVDVFGNPLRCGFGVFTRNHRRHLDEAAALCATDPERRITFRSTKRWVAAARAVAFGAIVPVYVAVVGGSGVEYEAELADIQLDPSDGDPLTKQLLALDTISTKGEKLWPARSKGRRGVSTLYVLKDVRSVTPFPLSKLAKARGGRLDDDYRYSYALVKPKEASGAC
jgi:hypothetical protein